MLALAERAPLILPCASRPRPSFSRGRRGPPHILKNKTPAGEPCGRDEPTRIKPRHCLAGQSGFCDWRRLRRERLSAYGPPLTGWGVAKW
jgi:hypothetical protein